MSLIDDSSINNKKKKISLTYLYPDSLWNRLILGDPSKIGLTDFFHTFDRFIFYESRHSL